jgi:hypothetical protein
MYARVPGFANTHQQERYVAVETALKQTLHQLNLLGKVWRVSEWLCLATARFALFQRWVSDWFGLPTTRAGAHDAQAV